MTEADTMDAPPTTKVLCWEYHIELLSLPSERIELLNEFGKEGWEAFEIIPPLVYFKRPYEVAVPDEAFEHVEGAAD